MGWYVGLRAVHPCGATAPVTYWLIRRSAPLASDLLGRDFRDMMIDSSIDEYDPTFTRFVAEALIARDGPQEISTRAEELGLSPVAKDVVVAACVGTACDCSTTTNRVVYETRR